MPTNTTKASARRPQVSTKRGRGMVDPDPPCGDFGIAVAEHVVDIDRRTYHGRGLFEPPDISALSDYRPSFPCGFILLKEH
jgi:hypothetical protein